MLLSYQIILLWILGLHRYEVTVYKVKNPGKTFGYSQVAIEKAKKLKKIILIQSTLKVDRNMYRYWRHAFTSKINNKKTSLPKNKINMYI